MSRVAGGGGRRERRDAQAGGSHRHQGHLLDGGTAARGALLDGCHHLFVVRGPLGDAAGPRGEGDGRSLQGEGVAVACAPRPVEGERAVRHQAVVPGGGGVHVVLGEGIAAARADVPFLDPQGVRQRAVVDADAVVVAGPGAQGGALGQSEHHLVAVVPGAADLGVAGSAGDGDGFPVHRQPGRFAPAGDAQTQRERDGPLDADGQGDGLVEGVVGPLPDGGADPVADLGAHLAVGVHRGDEAAVGREPEFLGEVGPAHAVVVRAAAVLVDMRPGRTAWRSCSGTGRRTCGRCRGGRRWRW